MSSDLKRLILSLGILIFVVTFIYVKDHYICKTIEYQNLSGAHSEQVCEWVNE